ncbi:MAG TPA: ankyrin repeat domain-containing protein [Bryobacteraceae bacterium]|jgi:hemoglobin|nr:ankyrin repeat domain-containing protein [Bryobacteraceae bacterium]
MDRTGSNMLFETIGGTETCHKLSQAFYRRVEHDPLLRPLFPGTTLRCAVDAFAAFLVQFLGGPSEDWQFRHWVGLRQSHARFAIGREHRDAWVSLMHAAIDDVGIDGAAREELRNFFDVAAGYMIGKKPGDRRMSRELAGRWAAQKTVDQTVAAIAAGEAQRAIRLAAGCPRAILPGVLGLMIGAGDAALLAYVQERVSGEPSLVSERYGGKTLLHAAAAAGSLGTVERLLQLGADPNALDGGRHTPLYSTGNECASAESAEVVHALVRGGALVDAHDGVTGATPLHMAARRGNAIVAQALLECGANVQARDRRGDTPRQRALNCRKAHMVELLARWAAN